MTQGDVCLDQAQSAGIGLAMAVRTPVSPRLGLESDRVFTETLSLAIIGGKFGAIWPTLAHTQSQRAASTYCMSYLMSILFVVATLSTGTARLISTALALELPRACNIDDPDLSAKELDVVADHPIFFYNNNNYKSGIYGLGQADPRYGEPPYTICRRYEFENTSSEVIKELRWPDVGISNISETPPLKRYRFPKPVLSNTKNVDVAPTTLFAWENIEVPVRTVFPLKVQIDKKAKFDFKMN